MCLNKYARITFAILLTAMAGVACSSKPAPVVDCGLPPPLPIPLVFLAYPAPGATGVADVIGTIVIGGPPFDYYGTPRFTLMTAQSGASTDIAEATPAPPPSPLPSPLAIPTGEIDAPFVGFPVPALSPATTYTVAYQYEDFSDQPPTCRTQVSQTLGSFTTQ